MDVAIFCATFFDHNSLATNFFQVFHPLFFSVHSWCHPKELMFPLDWQRNLIADGRFTVESDRSTVVKLGEVALQSASVF